MVNPSNIILKCIRTLEGLLKFRLASTCSCIFIRSGEPRDTYTAALHKVDFLFQDVCCVCLRILKILCSSIKNVWQNGIYIYIYMYSHVRLYILIDAACTTTAITATTTNRKTNENPLQEFCKIKGCTLQLHCRICGVLYVGV